jgi:hypothetical protein
MVPFNLIGLKPAGFSASASDKHNLRRSARIDGSMRFSRQTDDYKNAISSDIPRCRSAEASPVHGFTGDLCARACCIQRHQDSDGSQVSLASLRAQSVFSTSDRRAV